MPIRLPGRATIVSAVALMVPHYASAQSEAAVPQLGLSPQVQEANQKARVCRSLVPTGTMFASRICLTKAEWSEFAARNQADAEIGRRNRTAARLKLPDQN